MQGFRAPIALWPAVSTAAAACVRARLAGWLLIVVAIFMALAAPGLSHAQANGTTQGAQPASGLGPELDAQVRAFSQAATAALAGPARVDVQLGRLDPRLRLAPCARIEPYLPPGQRLWGRARIGLRCLQGAVRWNVFLPVSVHVYAPALVAAVPLAVGTTVKAEDLALAEVDLTAGTATTDAADLIGRSVRRPLAAGDAVLQEMLNVRRWFEAGERVELVAGGRGWRVRSQGEALMPGVDGRLVRIRTESGRVVAGRAVGPHRVEVSL